MAKQLSLPERIINEQMIHKDYSFASIGRNLDDLPLLLLVKFYIIAALPVEYLLLAKMIVFTAPAVIRIHFVLKLESMVASHPDVKIVCLFHNIFNY